MNVFDRIKHAFAPIERVARDAGQTFDPAHVADCIKEAIEAPVRAKLPGHASFLEAKDLISIARPDAIDVDVFGGLGVDLGIELEIEFDLGITIENPVAVVGAIDDVIEHPPETVHQLFDHLWAIAPSEVRVYERVQAGVGEQVQPRWYGQDVLKRADEYITAKGWMDRRLRA